MKKFTLLATMILTVVTITAQIIHVPSSKETIQAGIDAAQDGDTVLVAEGIYLENINFNGKAIILASHFILDDDTSHISKTIIDGSEPDNPDIGSVITLESGEDTTSVLCGFKITGGTGNYIPGFNARSGGGINAYPAGVKIIYNIIENNSVTTTNDAYGAGVLCDHEEESWLVLENNIIRNNQCNGNGVAFGSGVSAFGNARIENNIVSNNSSVSQLKESGSGINCQGEFYGSDFQEIIVTNNIIQYNSAYSNSTNTEGGYTGGLLIQGYYGVVSQNLITNNSVSAGEGMQCYGAGLMSLRNSDDILVENNIIQGNFFTSGNCWGGGICIWMGGGIYQNNVIQNNHASTGGGIFIYYEYDDYIFPIINNTITGNDATDVGGGLYTYASNVVVLNTIVWGNTSPQEQNMSEHEGTLEVRHSNIEGEEEWPGQGNMNVDPEFRLDGYHLYYPSLLVNEGKSTIQINGEYYDAPEYDIDGGERPFEDTFPDIGADEAMWFYTSVEEAVNSQNLYLSITPNPFSFSTAIAFELVTESSVNVSIYNHLGEIVNVLLNESIPEGKYNLNWNPENQLTGIYYCVLKTNKETQTIKMVRF